MKQSVACWGQMSNVECQKCNTNKTGQQQVALASVDYSHNSVWVAVSVPSCALNDNQTCTIKQVD